MITDLAPYPAMKDSGVPWLGKLPGHWEVARLKRICRLEYGDSLPADLRQEGRVPVFGSNGRVGFHSRANTKAPSIVVGRKGSFGKVNFSAEPVFAIDTTFFVDGRSTSADVRWLAYVLGWMRLDGISKDSAVPGLDREDAYQQLLVLPPLAEQAAIVRFLDHADRRIRRYIAAKTKLIGLLNEQKQATINRAVTRGLNPDVCLRTSGVAWLDRIPAHWEVVRAKRLFSPRRDLALPDDVQLSSTQAYGVIPQAEFEAKVGRRVVRISMHLEQRRHVEKDDFVISMRSFQGGLERAWASGAIRSSYVVLKPSPQVDVGFFSYLFKSRGYVQALQATADFIRDGQDLNFGNFCRVDLPLVALDEQEAIAATIAELTAGIDTAVARTEREIALVRQYRTRLIADVVTGRLDVRDAAAQLPVEIEEPESFDLREVLAEDEADSEGAADEGVA